MPALNDAQAAFLKFHLLKPAPHEWSWDGVSWSDAQTLTATRYLRGNRGPTESCSISREDMAALGPLGVWDQNPCRLAVSAAGRELLLQRHLEGEG